MCAGAGNKVLLLFFKPMLGPGPIRPSPGPTRRIMSNDKKPKKAKPAVVHGATSRGNDLASRLAEPAKKAAPAKKKK